MEKLKEVLRATPVAVQNLTANAKIKDLQSDIVDVTKSSVKMTSDYGAKIPDTDHWLKVVDPNGPNGQGPALLEDQFSREKVSRPRLFLHLSSYRTSLIHSFDNYRSIDLIMSVFQRESSTPVVLVLMDTSSSSSLYQNTPWLVY